MRVLAIDTSSMVASAAVADEEKLIGEITFNYKKQHSTILIPMIDELLKSLNMDINDVDGIACASGPGSFTGLRIGAATAKGLCHGAEKPLIGVPTLDALAYNIFYADGIVCPVMDALHDNVYTALYKYNDGKLVILDKYMAIHIDELIERLENYNEQVIFCGDAVFIQKEKLHKSSKINAIFAPSHLNMQRASSIAAIAIDRLKEGMVDDYLTFSPFYLRKSQAEREYEKKHGGEL